MILRRGDEIRYVTPGGAGYGDPGERSPERLAEDLREGYVTEAAAREHYGADAGAA